MEYHSLTQMMQMNKSAGGAFFDKNHTMDDIDCVPYHDYIIIRKEGASLFTIYQFNPMTGKFSAAISHSTSLGKAQNWIDFREQGLI